MKELFKFITLPQDKANHALWGLVIYSFVALYSPMIAILLVFVNAIGKEIWDSRGNGTVDKYDALATVIIPFILYTIHVI